jgi:nucleoside 2-deoxyribosyltransferase
MNLNTCPIWGTRASQIAMSDADYDYWNSPRAGGQYRIGHRADALLQKGITPAQRACLTTWLNSQRKAGERWPSVTFDLIADLNSLRSLNTTERFERALLYFNEKTRVGGNLRIIPSQIDDGTTDNAELMILTESPDKRELVALLEMLTDMGWLANTHSTMTTIDFTLTASGWLQVEELIKRLPDSSQAFVAMWFNDKTESAFKEGIEPAITELGYRAIRIDKTEHINKVDDQIIAEIRRSKFLVADFTCEPKQVRGGVYFEAGFAMALPIPVIWTCSESSMNDLHFDTRQYNHIVWKTPKHLRELLTFRIGAVIGAGPLKIKG